MATATNNPNTKPHDTPKVAWKGLELKRENLPKSLKNSKQNNSKNLGIKRTHKEIVAENNQDHLAPNIINEKTNLPLKLDPATFINKSEDFLSRNIGVPISIRKEGSVEVWQYKLSLCVVDFFLYKKNDTFFVKHTDMRSPELNSSLEQDMCMTSLNEISKMSNQ